MARPSPEQVTARLRRAAELSRDAPSQRGLDYSPAAVTSRLRELSDLGALCWRLGEIGRPVDQRG
ncbi:MAG: hypothetical protein IAG13_34750 [Deltaproteobacteria bacterium]|nr:hypothetical protein [Nannocystaceae bacterium]